MHRVILADRDGTSRTPMAAAILLENGWDTEKIELLVRGLVVLFQEPLSQKAEAVLAANGITMSDYRSVQLVKEDVDDDTLVVILGEKDRKATLDIIGDEYVGQVHVMTELTGEELEIMDPYGGPVGSYGVCFETMSISLKKFLALVREDAIDLKQKAVDREVRQRTDTEEKPATEDEKPDGEAEQPI